MSEESTEVQAEPTPVMVGGEPLADAAPVQTPPDTDALVAKAVEDTNRTNWQLLGLDPEKFDVYSPEARKGYMEQELAAIRTAQAPATGSEGETVPDNTQKADAPSVPNVPKPLNIDAVRSQLKQGFEDQDADAIMGGMNLVFGALQELAQFQTDLLPTVVSALEAQDARFGDVNKQLGSITRPQQLRAVLGEVKFANESDLPEADKLMVSGRTQSPQDALMLAAMARLGRDGLPNPAKATTDAQRTAAGLAAADASTRDAAGNEQRGFEVPGSLDSPEGQAAMADVARQTKAGRG